MYMCQLIWIEVCHAMTKDSCQKSQIQQDERVTSENLILLC